SYGVLLPELQESRSLAALLVLPMKMGLKRTAQLSVGVVLFCWRGRLPALHPLSGHFFRRTASAAEAAFIWLRFETTPLRTFRLPSRALPIYRCRPGHLAGT